MEYTDGVCTVWVGNNITGIDAVETQNLKIYPNPVKDELIIDNGQLKIEMEKGAVTKKFIKE